MSHVFLECVFQFTPNDLFLGYNLLYKTERMIGQRDVSMTAAGDCSLQCIIIIHRPIPDHFFVSFSVVDIITFATNTFGQDVEKAVHHPSSTY